MKYLTASTNRELDEILDLIGVAVQLTENQYHRAERSYHAVGEWLDDPASPLRPYRPTIFAQGSLALDTTVRPLSRAEFDLDLVCLMRVSDRMPPAEVYDFILQRIRDHGTYVHLIVEKPRCIRLDYAGDFHLDIVPAVPDPLCPTGETCLKIPDREKRIWRASNPLGYVRWFDGRATLPLQEKTARFSARANVLPLRCPVPAEGKPPLKLAVQLLKRWRDIAFSKYTDLAPASIVLTTLGGLLYRGEEHPTDALMTILDGIRDWAAREPICLRNPSNREEPITDRWQEKPEMYRAFLAEILEFRERWEKLITDGRFPDFADALKDLFGDYHVTRAFTTYGDRRRAARRSGGLNMDRASGVILPAANPGAVRVRDHTFHGE